MLSDKMGACQRLTTRNHGHMLNDKSDEGQRTSLRVEMGNPKLIRIG